MANKLVNFVFEQTGDIPEETLKVSVEGYTRLPFWKHDLKIKAAIALLETVDVKDFFEAGLEVEYFELLKKVEDMAVALQQP